MLNIGPQKEKRHFVQYYVRSWAKLIEILLVPKKEFWTSYFSSKKFQFIIFSFFFFGHYLGVLGKG